jgi:hypothetical protein
MTLLSQISVTGISQDYYNFLFKYRMIWLTKKDHKIKLESIILVLKDKPLVGYLEYYGPNYENVVHQGNQHTVNKLDLLVQQVNQEVQEGSLTLESYKTKYNKMVDFIYGENQSAHLK